MEKKWWHSAVVYQIYPRSFMDSNGDGIGDLQGIISKLDYLSLLGINVIWLSPVYASPMDDNGYDISNYQAIAPEFGTMADMDELIAKANELGIKIIMDLVVNHTSDEHPWFLSAKADKDSPYRDFYIFREPKFPIEASAHIEAAVPSDMQSIFSGSAWTYLEASGDYYFHLFSKKQPDLNWENPAVATAVYDMMNWWLDRGIGGFRMDVIDLIGKEIDKGITGNGPRLHGLLREMNTATFGARDVLTVGETWGATPEIAKHYSSEQRNELSMVFQFEHITAFTDERFGKWKPKPMDFQVLKQIFVKWQTELNEEGWNSLFWNNHDLPRAVSKFGSVRSEAHRVASGKMLATLLHGMKGTPYIYQGEELGMTNVAFKTLKDYRDIETLNAYRALVEPSGDGSQKAQNVMSTELLSHEEMMAGIYENGRDNARTPMQWSGEKNGGFSSSKPWIDLNSNYLQINAKTCLEDQTSIFYHYQNLIRIRKEHPALVYGHFSQLCAENKNCFVYQRIYGDEVALILVNHSEEVQHLELPESILTPLWHLVSYAPGLLEVSERFSNGATDHLRTVPKWFKTGEPLEKCIFLAPYESLIFIK